MEPLSVGFSLCHLAVLGDSNRVTTAHPPAALPPTGGLALSCVQVLCVGQAHPLDAMELQVQAHTGLCKLMLCMLSAVSRGCVAGWSDGFGFRMPSSWTTMKSES